MKTLIVTAALPYANGPIHLGHLIEYIQADIWVRFQKLRNNKCYFICADDTHGTPIMLQARKKNISPEEMIEAYLKEHQKDFKDFLVDFSFYGSTHSEENKKQVHFFYESMKKHVEKRSVMQLYDEKDKLFLPDRFVKGECPFCKAFDQYGDNCVKCGAVYSPMDLKNPTNAETGNKLVKKESVHLFFKLKDFQDFLKTWTKNHLNEKIYLKLKEWLDHDLKDWDFSRDAPYFGFEIPSNPSKYFYVWVDAPICYFSSFSELCFKENKDPLKIWNDEKTEIYHFIGKDIIYFHSLFWPSMLYARKLKTPNKIFVHGMLSVNGEKMSKSKGSLIAARTYLEKLDPQYLRYYYASKLGSSLQDYDLNFSDFSGKINKEFIGKVSNLFSRSAQMLEKRFEGKLGSLSEDGKKIIDSILEGKEEIFQSYEKTDYFKVCKKIILYADLLNKHFDENKPWILVKEDPKKTLNILTDILNAFLKLSIYLYPIIPDFSSQAFSFFSNEKVSFEFLEKNYENFSLKKKYTHLMSPIDIKDLESLIKKD